MGWPPLFLDGPKMPSAQLDFVRDDLQVFFGAKPLPQKCHPMGLLAGVR